MCAPLKAATVKTATALGVLSTKFDKVGLMQRTEQRDSFRYRVGKARHGQFMDVLGPTTGYDEFSWLIDLSEEDGLANINNGSEFKRYFDVPPSEAETLPYSDAPA